MKIFLRQKQYITTVGLICESEKTGAYIVCPAREDVERILNAATRLKLNIPCPLTFYEFLEGKYHGKGITGFLIDDVDLLLQRLSDVPVNAVGIRYTGWGNEYDAEQREFYENITDR